MKRTRYTDEQIIGILSEHEAGAKCADLCRKWEPNVKHHRQADDLGARFEIAKWIRFGHPQTLLGALLHLKPSSSDKVLAPSQAKLL